MNERQLLKIQKRRHMSDITIMIMNNAIFKNLSEKDQKKMATLIYKAEMIEVHARDKKIIRINESFQDIIESLMMSLDDDEEDRDGDFDDFDDRNK